ncbi:MAG: FtsK/SpoIIIE domain-containing protein [Verrucomicrobia bacterium]|nr:FtsK/SpoIIIE domain-containing protein [Verrucomicrobiota bacterium]
MSTANDPMTPGRVLEQVHALKAGMASGLASEEELAQARTAKLLVVRRENTHREEAETAGTTAQLADLATRHRHELERVQAALERRKAWIQTAYHNSRNSLAKHLQDLKDRRISHVQGTIVRDRKTRKQELSKASAAHRAFQEQLVADRKVRYQLRDSALRALRSFRFCLQHLFHGRNVALDDATTSLTAQALHAASREHLETLRSAVEALHRQPLAKFFRWVPLTALVVLAAGIQLWPVWRAGATLHAAQAPLLLSAGLLLALWLLALALALGKVRHAAAELATARALAIAAEQSSAARLTALAAAIEHEVKQQGQDLSATFRHSGSEWQAQMRDGQHQLDLKLARLPAKLEQLHQRKLAKLKHAHEHADQLLRDTSDTLIRARKLACAETTAAIDAEAHVALHALSLPWQQDVLHPCRHLSLLDSDSRTRFPDFTAATCATWAPPATAPAAVRIGSIQVDLAKLAGRVPVTPQLALPRPEVFAAPLALGFPAHGSLLIETAGEAAAAATSVLNTVALRLLASLPPGRASFVFIDPVGLGRDFAGLMHLADYEETLIAHRIWTQSTQIEERLAELNEHIEKVIQMYLRNEYATIAEYNEQAGTIAEKYRFLVIAGFPAAFSETAAKRLLAIASSGARCGVHLLIHRDLRLPAPEPALDDELRHACMRLVLAGKTARLMDWPPGANIVMFDPPPSDEDATTLIHRIGRASIDSNRVEVPFAQIAPAAADCWTLDTTDELRVPIGRTGAKKLQMLAIGKGTRQHMLVAGKTGSGKSTLFHVIITNLALWCSPEQVEFYLVDFKKGVEFKCYASRHLPHARVVAIESDREFALSVLQRVDTELKRRGELFRRAGAQDVAGYKHSKGAEPMPRTLLLIDEFQEFFTEDDAVAQEASLLLDRIVRQGRAFGLHVILGSQTLGGAYTLARATLGQMVIRVALQCNEADAHLIMDDDNPAPRLLTRPGEGIYNDQSGALAANSPFQIVWLPEAERDARLDQVNTLAATSGRPVPTPIIFEGNAPAEVRDNPELAAAIRSRPLTRPLTARAWLGAPNSIKGPTAALFQRQSGSHLLITGQAVERTISLAGLALLSLAAQYPPAGAEFVILDPHDPEASTEGLFQRLAAILPHRIRLAGPAGAPAILSELAATLDARAATAGRDAPEVFLFIHDLQRFKSLRPDDDFRFSIDDDSSAGPSPAQAFANLLGEGGPVGMHVIAAIDTWNNVSRWIPRKLLGEFEMRVLFQMSINDSSNLIDSPAASTLGMHRALFHNEHFGTLETFRPYAMPEPAWLEQVAAQVPPAVSTPAAMPESAGGSH